MATSESAEQIFCGVVERAIALGFFKKVAIPQGMRLGMYVKSRLNPQSEKRWCELTNCNVNVYPISEALDEIIIEYFTERIRYWRERKMREQKSDKPKPKLKPKAKSKLKRELKLKETAKSSARTFDLTGMTSSQKRLLDAFKET